jgi:hypothetical protein
MSDAFQKQIRSWGIAPSYAFVGEPQTMASSSACAEPSRSRSCTDVSSRVDNVQDAVRTFAARHNAEWLIEKNGHQSPEDARAAWHDQPFRRTA